MPKSKTRNRNRQKNQNQKAKRQKRELEHAQTRTMPPRPPIGGGFEEITDGTWRVYAARRGHQLSAAHGYQFEQERGHDLLASMHRQLAIDHVQPETLEECGTSGHQQQAWRIMRKDQDEGQECVVCGETPDFPDWESSEPGRGFQCEILYEDIDDDNRVTHELTQCGSEYAWTYCFESELEYEPMWPLLGSTNLSTQPYPGDDNISLEWTREELRLSEKLEEPEQMLNPFTMEPLTDESLRAMLAEYHEKQTEFDLLMYMIATALED